jgi:CBS domain-containing protein
MGVTMLAKEIMATDVVTVALDTPIEEIAQILIKHHISAVPVIDAERHILGIVSEGDLMRRPETETERPRSWWLALVSEPEERARDYVKTHGRHAADVMTRPVSTVREDATLGDIAQLLEERRIKRVPVVREARLVGIVSRADLLRALASGKAPAPVPAAVDDQTIRNQILDTMREEELATIGYVNVVVTDGIVHLWGMVGSAAERAALRVAAESTPGVRAVEDHLAKAPPTAWAE